LFLCEDAFEEFDEDLETPLPFGSFAGDCKAIKGAFYPSLKGIDEDGFDAGGVLAISCESSKRLESWLP